MRDERERILDMIDAIGQVRLAAQANSNLSRLAVGQIGVFHGGRFAASGAIRFAPGFSPPSNRRRAFDLGAARRVGPEESSVKTPSTMSHHVATHAARSSTPMPTASAF